MRPVSIRLDNKLPSDTNSSLPLRPGQADTDICLETTVHKWAGVCRLRGGGGLYLTCQIGYIRCNTLQRHFIPMLISHPELWAIHNFQRIIMKNLFYAKKLQ